METGIKFKSLGKHEAVSNTVHFLSSYPLLYSLYLFLHSTRVEKLAI